MIIRDAAVLADTLLNMREEDGGLSPQRTTAEVGGRKDQSTRTRIGGRGGWSMRTINSNTGKENWKEGETIVGTEMVWNNTKATYQTQHWKGYIICFLSCYFY